MAGDPTVANAQLDALYGKSRDGALSDRELLNDSMPDLSALTTEGKANLVSALNEVSALVGGSMVVSTVAALATTVVPAYVQRITLLGYYSAFDGGGHTRKRGTNVASALPSSGAYWEYVSPDGKYNIKHFGAKVDGATDDTVAIDKAIAALPQIAGSFSTSSAPVLYFPAGRTITQGGHTLPNDRKVKVLGDGNYNSVIYLKSGSSADVLTINATTTVVEGISIDGNRGGATGNGDGLVINASFVRVVDVRIMNARGDCLAIGKTASAINFYLAAVDIRYALGYGVKVYPSTGSTDGAWFGVNVGACGLSGFYIGTGAQKMHGCHAWGNGLESTTDHCGFWLNSGSNMLSGCESETNLGDGIRIVSGIKANSIVGGSVWGNNKKAINIYGGATQNNITGVEIRNNCVSNTAGATGANFAQILIDGSTYNTVSGCTAYDDGSAIDAGSYSGFTPTYPYPGRTAVYTAAAHYGELTGSDYNTITGNVFRASLSRSGVAIVNVGVHNHYAHNSTGLTGLNTVASAATITIPAEQAIVQITGSTAITTINASARGKQITLIFAASGCVVTNGNNISIGSNYTSTAGGNLTLICDGTNWYRV